AALSLPAPGARGGACRVSAGGAGALGAGGAGENGGMAIPGAAAATADGRPEGDLRRACRRGRAGERGVQGGPGAGGRAGDTRLRARLSGGRMFEVRIPNLGESVTEATIAHWEKNDGDVVGPDDMVLELESDKATMELPAGHAGVLRILKQAGETVAE